jgi:hypothetical protein
VTPPCVALRESFSGASANYSPGVKKLLRELKKMAA